MGHIYNYRACSHEKNARISTPSKCPNDAKESTILQVEIICALPALNTVHAEMMKLMNTRESNRLFNNIYENGKIPNDWRLTSTFVTIPKKSNAKTSKDHMH